MTVLGRPLIPIPLFTPRSRLPIHPSPHRRSPPRMQPLTTPAGTPVRVAADTHFMGSPKTRRTMSDLKQAQATLIHHRTLTRRGLLPPVLGTFRMHWRISQITEIMEVLTHPQRLIRLSRSLGIQCASGPDADTMRSSDYMRVTSLGALKLMAR